MREIYDLNKTRKENLTENDKNNLQILQLKKTEELKNLTKDFKYEDVQLSLTKYSELKEECFKSPFKLGHFYIFANIGLVASGKSTICDICKIPADDLKRGLCFDHDHKTGKFRGWICYPCNLALGFSRDNIEILEAMIEYLRKAGVDKDT